MSAELSLEQAGASVPRGLPATSQGKLWDFSKAGLLPADTLRQRPVCSLCGRLLRLWKTGNGPGFPQAEPSPRSAFDRRVYEVVAASGAS